MITRTNEDILKSLCDGICASGRNTGANRHLIMGQVLHLEFAPYINRIISPPLRPVSAPRFLSTTEIKAELFLPCYR